MDEQAPEVKQTAEERVSDILFGKQEPEEPQEELEDDSQEIEASEEEAEDSETPVKEEEELYEIQVGDKVYEVPADLRDSFVMQKDYTQKTQKVAEREKELNVIQSAVKQKEMQYEFINEVQDEVNQSQVINWQIEEYRNYMRDNIDSLSGQEIEKIRFKIDELNASGKAIQESVTLKYQQHQQAVEQARKELREKSTDVLQQKVKGWSDQHEAQAREFAKATGFTDQELENALDPREWEVLWKAAQYDRLQAGKSVAVQKVQGAPQIKPKSRSPMPEGTKRKISTRKRLNNARTDKDKASIIQDDIAQRLGL